MLGASSCPSHESAGYAPNQSCRRYADAFGCLADRIRLIRHPKGWWRIGGYGMRRIRRRGVGQRPIWQGRYHFTGLAPGRYQVLSSFDFNQPTNEEMEAARAVTIALKEGTETSKDLELFVAR
jgi:hypothetical protein